MHERDAAKQKYKGASLPAVHNLLATDFVAPCLWSAIFLGDFCYRRPYIPFPLLANKLETNPRAKLSTAVTTSVM